MNTERALRMVPMVTLAMAVWWLTGPHRRWPHRPARGERVEERDLAGAGEGAFGGSGGGGGQRFHERRERGG